MLRAAVLALLLANLAFFAWTQGWLDSVVGVRSIGDREPERLLRQVHPERIRVLPPLASSAAAGAATAPACLEAGPFTATELASAEAALNAAWSDAPVGAWTSVKTELPGTWIVYLGRYPSLDAMNRKQEELGRRNLPFEAVTSPVALDPGLSLGRFDDRAGASRALEQFAQQGIRSARVVEVNAPTSSYRLRADAVDAAVAAQLAGLPADALAGRAFSACAARAG